MTGKGKVISLVWRGEGTTHLTGKGKVISLVWRGEGKHT